jgi:hypothetical protein
MGAAAAWPVEIDLAEHCGTSIASHYLNTLTVTDIASGWTECAAVWSKGQAGVVAALEEVRGRLPFRLLGIDSDNGSEFLNAHLVRYCQAQLTFRRSRPYWKNDQAHVEQKNWSVVRNPSATSAMRVLAAGALYQMASQRLEHENTAHAPLALRRKLDSAVDHFWRLRARTALQAEAAYA